ncbi:MAG TPA: hypothetical protein PKM70_05980 [Clostridia bacterium]|nr:hypothetical protein [Clostridia bacterium]
MSVETLGLRKLQEIICSISNVDELENEDIIYLTKWIESNSKLAGNYLYDKICGLLNYMVNDDEMLYELKRFVCPIHNSGISGDIDLENKTVCLTGNFELGSKEQVEELLTSMGATCKNSVNKKY